MRVIIKKIMLNIKPVIAKGFFSDPTPQALKIIPIMVHGYPNKGIIHAIIEHNPKINPTSA